MNTLTKKAVVMIIVVSLIGIPAAYALEMLTVPLVKSFYDSAIKWKFEPGLWEKLRQLEANGTERLMIIVVGVSEGASYDFKKWITALLVSRHNATILHIGEVLSFVNIQVMNTEVKKIAAYSFVDGLGDGEAEGSICISSGYNKNTIEAITYPFKLTLNLNKTEYKIGELVTIELQLTNIGNSTVKLWFRNRSSPTWLRFKVYNASNDLVFVSSPAAWPAGTEVSLDPGSFIGQTHEWDQKVGDPRYPDTVRQLKAGTYKIVGFLDNLYAPQLSTLETPKIEISVGQESLMEMRWLCLHVI